MRRKETGKPLLIIGKILVKKTTYHKPRNLLVINAGAAFGLRENFFKIIVPIIIGASRGFAFVEFASLTEAVRWKELTQVLLIYP